MNPCRETDRGERSTVLIVDDDARLVNGLRVVLEAEGYNVVTASNGSEAFERLCAQACDCMLLDLRMPLFNGTELLAIMERENLVVPTIVMSGEEDGAAQIRPFPHVVAFLAKPCEGSRVIQAVRSCLARAVPVKLLTEGLCITGHVVLPHGRPVAERFDTGAAFVAIAEAEVATHAGHTLCRGVRLHVRRERVVAIIAGDLPAT